MKPSGLKGKITPYPLITLILVVATLVLAWYTLHAQNVSFEVFPDPIDGISDASSFDLEQSIGRISREMDFYPNRLYTPADFLSDDIDRAQDRSDIEKAYSIPYGTFRVVTKLTPNTYYSISGYSVDYATNLFVNGTLMESVGTVSSDPDIAVARVNYMHLPVYIGQDGILDLVVQYSNFAHKEGGSIPNFYISSSSNINRFIIESGLSSYILSGGFLVLAAYYLLDSILRKRHVGLLLSASCLLFALRDQWFYIVSLIPEDYNWYVHYRVITSVVMLTPIAVLMLIQAVYPKIVSKRITQYYTIINLIGLIALFAVPTQNAVTVSMIVQVIAIPYTIYLVASIVRYYVKRKEFKLKDLYITMGTIILISTAIADSIFSDTTPSVTRGGITPIGMLLFVIIYISVLAIQASEDEAAVQRGHAEREMLAKLSEVKSDFFQKMAHEIKTPLTIMSGYAQLTNIQIINDEVTAETSENLKVISSEAKRLAALVSNLVQMPTKQPLNAMFEEISLTAFLQYSTIICTGVLDKSDSVLKVENSGDISVLGNMEMLVQMMLNLCINSSKHMNSGQFTIEVDTQDDGQTAVILVSDTGSGICPQHADKIFEKGFTTSGTKGLGLFICKEIADLHKGDIVLLQSSDKGTTFKISLPIFKAEEGEV